MQVTHEQLAMMRDFILTVIKIDSAVAEIELEKIAQCAINGGYDVREMQRFREACGNWALGSFYQAYSDKMND